MEGGDLVPVVVVQPGIAAGGDGQADEIHAAVPSCSPTNVTPRTESLGSMKGEVILWPDNDEEGRRHMVRIAAWLAANGATPHLIVWADAPPKGDAVDFFARGHTVDELEQLIARAPAATSETLSADTPVVAAETNLRFRTAREIADETPAEIEWIAPRWAARGAITEVDGKIKSAGKTTWITFLCRTVLDGLDFMGDPTVKTKVVYLTEQSPSTFREALRRADLIDRDDFVVLFWRDTAGLKWPEVARQAVQEALRLGAGLLVVDTLGQFAGLSGDSENSAGDALAAMEPLQEAAATHDLAVVIARHERKSGGDVGDSGRGSSAFAGAVDIVLSLRRGEGNTRPTVRVIHGLSRYDETPDTLAIELTENGYVALGSATAVAAAEARKAILEVVPTTEETAMKLDDLQEAAQVKRTPAQDAVKQLVTDGLLCETGGRIDEDGKRKGVRKNPVCYWQPPAEDEIDSAAIKGGVAAESIREVDPAHAHAGLGSWIEEPPVKRGADARFRQLGLLREDFSP
jgi:hypothetical protein